MLYSAFNLLLLTLPSYSLAWQLAENGGYLSGDVNNTYLTHDHEKRYYSIAEGDALAPYWPDKTITYCYADSDSESAISPYIQRAWGLWITAGVSDSLKFTQGTSSQCGDANRALVLLITVNTNGKMMTSTGRTPASSTSDGPSMAFDVSSTIGMQDTVANLAHEIGHAWGLLHEHQRLDAWKVNPWNGKGQTDLFQFTCSNLRDYSSKLAANGAQRMQLACQSRSTAAAIGFSASDMLPYGGGTYGGDFDWDSIMLYGSKIGGDGTKNVLVKADGTAFDYNTVPSEGDVARLTAMYLSDHANSVVCPAWKDCSTKKSFFKKTFAAIKGKKSSCLA